MEARALYPLDLELQDVMSSLTEVLELYSLQERYALLTTEPSLHSQVLEILSVPMLQFIFSYFEESPFFYSCKLNVCILTMF